MALVGSFPFNSFMSRFLSGIGTAVLAVFLAFWKHTNTCTLGMYETNRV